MEYVLTLNDDDLKLLNAALGELPMKIAAPFVQKLNEQLAAQKTVDIPITEEGR